MSRYTKEIDKRTTLAYGFDDVFGYFFDVIWIDRRGREVTRLEESSLLTNLSNGMMIELMKEYELPEEHIDAVTLEIPF